MRRKIEHFKASGSSGALSGVLSNAKNLHREGKVEQARKLYLRLLKENPEYPEVLHFLGILRYHHDRDLDGITMVKKSIELSPQHSEWYNNLGNMLLTQKEFTQAIEAFKNSIAITNCDANIWNNMGAALQQISRFDEGEAAYRKAIELNPDFIPALNNLGAVLSQQGRYIEAAEYLCRAFVLSPASDQSKLDRGSAFYRLGRIREAAEVYRQWMDEEPDNPIAAHLYTACAATSDVLEAPARASDCYVETNFDNYALDYDTRMAQLSYVGPALMAAALARETAPQKQFRTLDAGCGTGLCASVLKLFSRHLTGVDLSHSMLNEAGKRGLYDSLVKDELTSYLGKHNEAFDLIATCDTLTYFGVLEEALSAAAKALSPDGLMVFTVEHYREGEGTRGFYLNPHGRYSHTRPYVESTLRKAGFKVLDIRQGVLRKEWGNPVECLVVTARKMKISLIKRVFGGAY
ncbi:MAG: tetratricopeptide repeat protein [Nitrospirae bacterium]|nr:tetratricopeptide repeat protein [Nitrospirota bacterium]